jgi:hypothetical protein
MSEGKLFEWLIILATLSGPILAVQAQKFIERIRENRNERLWVFHTLMATREARLSENHVRALNTIDLAFYGRKSRLFRFQFSKEKRVSEAWKAYRDHLNQPYSHPEEFNNWFSKGTDLFTDLLHTMSQALNYDFDKVDLRRGVYQPRAHADQELANLIIRDNLVNVLSGKQAIAMSIVSLPERNAASDDKGSSHA